MLPGISLRSPELKRADDQQPAHIVGYGAVFYRESDPGTEYQLWEEVYERILPGAFDRAIREDDVRSFFNHDPNRILGRNRSNTLVLSVDDFGVNYDTTPPKDEPVIESVRRGDVSGSSFMFEATDSVWREQTRDGNTIWIREITGVKLWEIGPVVFPAYEATTAAIRGQRSEARGQPVAPAWRSWYDAHLAEARTSFANRFVSGRAQRARRDHMLSRMLATR